jgi:hypothetical protein
MLLDDTDKWKYMLWYESENKTNSFCIIFIFHVILNEKIGWKVSLQSD